MQHGFLAIFTRLRQLKATLRTPCFFFNWRSNRSTLSLEAADSTSYRLLLEYRSSSRAHPQERAPGSLSS